MLEGIDVSKAQGIINWKSVTGVEYAACKATEGIGYLDSQFKNNWAGIKDANIIRGAYHYAHTVNDPTKEANWFISQLTDLNMTDFLALDIEDKQSVFWGKFSEWCLVFLDVIEQKTGIVPFVYTGGPFFDQHSAKTDAKILEKFKKYPLWLAAYVTNPDKFVPAAWKTLGWTVWQRSGDVAASGDTLLHVPGINGVVDRNQFKGTRTDFEKLVLNLHSAQNNSVTDAINIISG
jgi:lysozyme